MKVYIAFSIHGTNAFITATRELPHSDVSKIGGEFKVIPSRRADYDITSDGVKLQWARLNTVAGKPLRSPAMILARFKELEQQGWTVNKAAFVAKHYRKKE